MPVDCEMLYAANTAVFSSPYVDYTFATFSTRRSSKKRINMTKSLPVRVQLPLRSCLILRDVTPPTSPVDDLCEGLLSSALTSPNKLKKRVVFADDRGFSLTEVKIMSEPSNCPPRWKDDFLEQVTKGATATAMGRKWELLFAQPASNYLEFRQKLDKNYVSLENMIVRENDETMSGTIKVKNVSFSKEVFVRTTFNNWISQTDIEATYVPSGCEGTSIHELYDTFSFEFKIPSVDVCKCQRIEMCFCFKSDTGEFWDSNEGKNYCVTSLGKNLGSAEISRFDDVVKATFDTWTEFASWNHLSNDCPYW